jgi:glycosyltransferase involved in cell wall biosynthesis
MVLQVNKIPLSVAVITKNEEKNLSRCLESVPFAAEIVILDSGSTDRTEQIARQFHARWFVETWKGYGPQKNSALLKCTHDWVLVLDADERIPSETAESITRVLSRNDTADAYVFKRKNFFHDKWIKYADWWPDEVTRLLKRSSGRYERVTHESWVTSGKTEKLGCVIEHFSYGSYFDMFRALNGYSTQLAEQMHSEGKKAGIADAFFHSFWMFLRNYFLRMGFMAGFDGFMVSFTKAVGTFLKYAKLYELEKFRHP